ncbi:MAG: hypothetical protein V5A55_06160 [Halovenus sp.]
MIGILALVLVIGACVPGVAQPEPVQPATDTVPSGVDLSVSDESTSVVGQLGDERPDLDEGEDGEEGASIILSDGTVDTFTRPTWNEQNIMTSVRQYIGDWLGLGGKATETAYVGLVELGIIVLIVGLAGYAIGKRTAYVPAQYRRYLLPAHEWSMLVGTALK